MSRVALSAAAAADLRAIAVYTAERWGAVQARLYLDALEARLAALAERPRSGRLRPELGNGLRSFPFQSHVVFYLGTEDGIAVARILHERQDAGRQMG